MSGDSLLEVERAGEWRGTTEISIVEGDVAKAGTLLSAPVQGRTGRFCTTPAKLILGSRSVRVFVTFHGGKCFGHNIHDVSTVQSFPYVLMLY